MKLGLHAYQLGQTWDVDTIISNCVETGMASYEFFTHPDYLEPLDLDTPKEKRAEVKKKFEKAGIAIAGLAILERYDWLEEDKVKEAVEKTKEYVLMAEEMGIPRLRCLGDQLHEDEEPREKTIERVAAALKECCEFSDGHGVDCAVEMHGKFAPWEISLALIKQVDHPRCYLVHNSQPSNTPPEQFDEVWEQISPHVKHVHFHNIENPGFPYEKFIHVLRDGGYDGCISLESSASEDPIRVLHLTKALFEAYLKT